LWTEESLSAGKKEKWKEYRLAALVANAGILDNWSTRYERPGMKKER
jgi:hypothetical protein